MRWVLTALCLAVALLGWTAQQRPREEPRPATLAFVEPRFTTPSEQPQAIQRLLLQESDPSIYKAIVMLEDAAARAPEDARILSDLAAAYLIRAQRRDRPYDLVLALSTADKALRIDGDLPEARFNRALLLQRMSLATEATLAWQTYLLLDEVSGWSDRAELHLQELNRPAPREAWQEERQALSEAALRGDRSEVERIVARFRQPARQYVENTLLAEWADAMDKADRPGADRALDIARSIGAALVRLGGDSMAQDAVAAIDRAGSALVQGHLAYGLGARALEKRDVQEALPHLKSAEAELVSVGSPFRHWARLQLASCFYFHERFWEASRILQAIDGELRDSRYLVLRGRIQFILGSMDVLQGRPGDSLRRFAQARTFFEKAGEAENLATIDQHDAITLGFLGSKESWRPLFLAIRRVGEVHNERRVFAILDQAGLASLQSGQPNVALYFQDELLRVARRRKDPEQIVAALQRRADSLAAAGNPDAALRDLRVALQEADGILDSHIRSRMQAHIQVSLGQLHVSSHPELAVQELTEAIRYLSSSPYRFYLSLAFFLRARAHLAAGEGAAAGEDFRAGRHEIESLRENLGDDRLRTLFTDHATQLFDEILAFEAGREGGAESAFELAEQTRARELLEDVAAASAGRSIRPAGEEPLSVSGLQAALPGRTLVLKYAVLPDSVLLWTLTRRKLSLHTIRIDAMRLERQVAAATKALRSDAGDVALSRLHALLIGPAEKDLKSSTDLVVVPDKSLYLLPFAALIDPKSGRFLMQDHALVVAPNVNVYARGLWRSRASGPPETALLVGDPSFDRGELPSLSRLPAAEAEAEEIADMYPRSDLLTREAATRNTFKRMVPGVEVLQLSTHAILSAEHPEYSRLVLAPDGSDADSGALYLHEVRNLDLGASRLVVLAGCGTAGGQVSPSEGTISLARSFLAAGAPTVLASLWEIDDAASREMLVEFHRRLRSGESPMAALRSAQVELSGSKAGGPWNWASFQLLGSSAPTRQGERQ